LQYQKKKVIGKISDSRINSNNCKENLISIISISKNGTNDLHLSILNDIITENRILFEKIRETFKIKSFKEKQLNSLTLELVSKMNWEKEKILSSNNEINFIIFNIKDKDQIIENLKREIEKFISSALEFRKEIYLANPKKPI